MKKDDLMNELLEEIREIIKIMKEILYSPEYSILFGRINIEKPKIKEEKNTNIKEINLFN